MPRVLLALLTFLHLMPGVAAAEELVPESSTNWLCRYAYDGDLSFIECAAGDIDEALTDEPPLVKRLQIFTLPMNEEDLAFAEQLVDSVLCYNVPSCTAVLTPPLRS